MARRFHVLTLLGTLALLMLSIGGVFLWTRVTAVVLLTIANLGYALNRSKSKRSVSLPRLALGGFAFALLPFLWVIPLPQPLLALINPLAGQVQADLAAATGQAAAGAPLSLDGGATLEATLRFSLYLMSFLLGSFAARRRRQLKILMDGVVWLGVTASTIAFIQALLGAEAILGVYTPTIGAHRAFSTFANGNHLGAFLCLTSGLTLGLVLNEKSRDRARWLLTGFLVQATHLLLVPSGNAVLTVPLVLILALATRALRPERRALKDEWAIRHPFSIVLVVSLLALGSLLLLDLIAPEFNSTKPSVLLRLARLVPLAPLFGAGPDAFWGFAARFGPPAGQIFATPENIVLQMIFDLGAPLALIAFLTLALAVWGAIRARVRTRSQLGLLVAIVAFGIHELADFGVWIPAIGALFFALLGALMVRPVESDEPRRSLRLRPLTFALLVVLVGGSSLGAVAASRQLIARDRIIGWRSTEASPPAVAPRDAIARGHWFPLDSRAWLRLAIQLDRAGEDEAAGRLYEYTALIAPNRPDLYHFWLPWLRTYDAPRHEAVMRELAAGFRERPGASHAAKVVPRELLARPDLAYAPRRVLGDRVDLVQPLLVQIASESPQSRKTLAYMLLYDYPESLEVLEKLGHFAGRHQINALADDVLAALQERFPEEAATHHMRAQARFAAGDLDGAIDDARLAVRLRRTPVLGDHALLVEVQLAAGRLAEAREAIARVSRTFPQHQERARALLVRLHITRKDYELALSITRHMLADHPGDVRALSLHALVLQRSGHLHDAARAYETLANRTRSPEHRAAAKRLRQEVERKRRDRLIEESRGHR